MNMAIAVDPIPPIDRFDPAVMRRYRLLPIECNLDGFIWYAENTHTIGVSSPRKHQPPPVGTDTIFLSIGDYRRVTKAIADAEAGGA